MTDVEGNISGGEFLFEDVGDFPPDALRVHGRAALEWLAHYLETVEERPVLARTTPGATRSLIPAEAPAEPEPLAAILADLDRVVLPGLTHWNHPGFLAYFATTGSVPGILAELITAGLNVNPMLWRTAPAAAELELATTDWVRRLLGLPDGFLGMIFDTASISTFHALAAAREAQADLQIREKGLAGRPDLPELVVYASDQARSSVEKAVIALGLGQRGLRRVPSDSEYRMDVAALNAAVAADRTAGRRPIAVVATVGTTSTTSVDPVRHIAAVCAREAMWLHVDAAYAGVAAAVPEMRWVMDGADSADSIVVNPHKWLFTPMDLSVLLTKRPDVLRAAFSLVPEYLTDPAAVAAASPPSAGGPGTAAAIDLMDYGLPLGRRFRALKLWFVLRAFGRDGIVRRLRHHMALARTFAGWVAADPRFELMAPVPFSVVCFRALPNGDASEAAAEALNRRLLEAVNASGEAFLSHTKLRDRFALRLAIGNLQTRERHLARVWALLGQELDS